MKVSGCPMRKMTEIKQQNRTKNVHFFSENGGKILSR